MTGSVLCVDFGGTNIKMGMVEDRELRNRAVLRQSGGDDPNRVVAALRELAVRAERGEGGRDLDAVAIAVPAVVSDGRTARSAPGAKYSWAIGRDLAGWAEETFGVPVVVENDARAALIGELEGGVAVGVSDVALVTLGTGVGTAIALNGQVLRGRDGHAGNVLGHTTVDLNAGRCPCGNVGCAEFVGQESLRLSGSADFAELMVRAATDPAAQQYLDLAVRAWGAMLTTTTHAYEPSMIVLAGGIAQAGERLSSALSSYLDEHLWSTISRPHVVIADHPEDAVLLGLSELGRTTPKGPRA